jgi:hypothetical protein
LAVAAEERRWGEERRRKQGRRREFMIDEIDGRKLGRIESGTVIKNLVYLPVTLK